MRTGISIVTLAAIFLTPACSANSGNKEFSSTMNATSAATSPVGQVLFDSSRDCQANPLANFWHCMGPVAKIAPQPLASTTQPFLKSLGAMSTLKYSFKCDASESLVASLKVAGGHVLISSTPNGDVLSTAPVTLHPESDAYEIQVFDQTSDGTAIVTSACKFVLLGNLSLPPLDPIKTSLDQMVASLKGLTAAYAKVSDPAARLDAEAAMKQGLVITRQRLADLVEKFAQTASTSVDDRDYFCKQIGNTWGVGGEVDEFGDVPLLASYDQTTRQLVEDQCLKIDGVLTEGSMVKAYRNLRQCLAQPEADCGDSVNAGRQTLALSIASAQGEISDLLDFLTAERQRLAAVMATLSEQIQTLISEIRDAVATA